MFPSISFCRISLGFSCVVTFELYIFKSISLRFNKKRLVLYLKRFKRNFVCTCCLATPVDYSLAIEVQVAFIKPLVNNLINVIGRREFVEVLFIAFGNSLTKIIIR